MRECEGAALLFVDSFRAAAPSLEENSSEMRRALDTLARVSERTGVVPVVIHHASKPSKERAGGAKTAIRGSGAIFDACSSVFVFDAEKGAPTKVTHEKARTSGVLREDFYLDTIDVEVDGDPRGGIRIVPVDAPTADKGDAFEVKLSRVRAFVRDNPDTTGNQVRVRLKMKRDDAYAAVEALTLSGEIVNLGTDKAPKLRLRA